MYNQKGVQEEAAVPTSTAVKKAMEMQGGRLYKNPLDCLIQTVRAEGPLAVYKVSPCRM
jgi:hypothetical protein